MGNLKTLVSLILTLDSTSLHLASVSPELQRWAEKKTQHTKIIYLSAVFVEDTTAGAEVGDSEELQGQEIAEEEKLKRRKSHRGNERAQFASELPKVRKQPMTYFF